MISYVPISEAKAKLAEIVRDSADTDVLLMRHGRPAAVVIGFERHESLIEKIGDMQDRLSVYEREGLTVDLDKLAIELGFNDD